MRMSNESPGALMNSEDDFGSVIRTPLYFGPDNKRLIGWLHRTNSHQQGSTGVVICPPLAVEYMSTYRSMRYVADYFALAGIPAFRFDYHGTGDSSGSNDDGNRLDEWLWSIEQANDEVKRLTGCVNVGLFGLRMGATLAAIVSEKIDFDFLVLWAALESGRRYIREIRAVQMTGTNQCDDVPDLIEAGGMVYWPQTADAISNINLLKVKPRVSRILIIPRDDLKANTTLKEAWETHGVKVEQIEYPGSSDMCLLALRAVVPHESILNIVEWVKKAAVSEQGIIQDSRLVEAQFSTNAYFSFNAKSTENKVLESELKESFVRYGDDARGFAILTEPARTARQELPVIVFANSGATHRVGPSRLYVLLSRELAHLGFRCLRFDIPGLGDSIIDDCEEENKEYIEQSSVVVRQALESFGAGYKGNKYIITGLCSGGYFSFHAALDLEDVNVVESMMINPLTFYWYKGMEFDTSPTKNFGYWNWYKKAIQDPGSWLKFFRGGADYATLFDTIKNRIKIVVKAKLNSLYPHDDAPNDLNIDLIKLSDKTHLSFVLSRSDPGYDILMTSAGKVAKKLIKEGMIDIHFIEDADHTFSKYKPRCDVVNVVVRHISSRYC